MTKYFYSFILFLVSLQNFGQSSETSNAIIRLREGNIAEAKSYIDKAYEIVQTKSMNEKSIKENLASKFWYYRGEIYFQIHISKDPKIRALSKKPLDIATESFQELFKVDVEARYTKEGKEKFKFCVNGYVNKAFDAIDRKEWIEAMNYFETAYGLKQTSEFGNVIDTLTLYNAALMAQFGEDYDNAIRINQQLIDLGYGGAATYKTLSDIYRLVGDIESSKQVLREGLEKYPNAKEWE